MRKFPFVKQPDAMACGVACLAMICRHFGRDYSCETLSRYCSPTAEGVSMLAITQGAEALGLETLTVRIRLSAIRDEMCPCILHWNNNHFVVLYGVDRRGRYLIADPGKGLTRKTAAEMARHWTAGREDGEGVAMFVDTGERWGCVPPDSSDGERRSLRFIMGYIMRYRAYFGQIALGMALGCVLQLVMPFLTQAIVDKGINRGDISLIWMILIGELAIVAGRTVTDFIRRWLLLHISLRINISLLSDFFIKLLSLPMSFFDTRQTGDLLQRMSDHGRVQSFMTSQTLSIAFTALSFVVFGIVLLIYDYMIFAVFIAGSALYLLWVTRFMRRRKVLDYEMFEQSARNQNKTYEFITSMQEIKLQDCERRRRHEWEDVQADLFGVQMQSLRLQQTQEAGSIFLNEIKNLVITILTATAVINGHMTFGQMLAVQYIIGQLNSPVEQLIGFIYSVQDVRISLERINAVHTSPDESAGSRCLTALPDSGGTAAPGLTLSGVTFRYDRHSPRPVLEDIDIHIPAGRVTAIVGPSGSGKTTLVKLMLGYYRPEAGTVSVNGIPLHDIDPRWWRRRCGTVMQEGVIFSESIARNIAVDDGDVDTERLRRAARAACILDFIETLPLGFDTIIGREGTGLSRGQQQRILIARAIYRAPQYIFMDEATNSLDAANERDIVANLGTFFKGRTVVVVAHRLSTVRDADNIIVVDGGRVVEQGTHAALTARRGAYYNLIRNQLELGQ